LGVLNLFRLVYLVLAAQYESFILPLAVILSLPQNFLDLYFAKSSRFREQHLCTSGDGYAYTLGKEMQY
jgi:hypothetical protein